MLMLKNLRHTADELAVFVKAFVLMLMKYGFGLVTGQKFLFFKAFVRMFMVLIGIIANQSLLDCIAVFVMLMLRYFLERANKHATVVEALFRVMRMNDEIGIAAHQIIVLVLAKSCMNVSADSFLRAVKHLFLCDNG